jgi:hypothetical protein
VEPANTSMTGTRSVYRLEGAMMLDDEGK